MTVPEIIKFLRLNIIVQDAGDVSITKDPQYLSMTDDDMMLYLNIAMTRDFSKVRSLDYLPTENIYPLVLLAKKELYFALASKDAPLFDLTADNNNQLKRSDRFEHYMALIAEVDKQYIQYNEDVGTGTRNTLTSYDVLLSDRYNTKHNYSKGIVPVLSLFVDSVSETQVEITWEVAMSRFLNYNVYLSTEPILDVYNLENKISTKAKLLVTIKNVKQTGCRIEQLVPNTTYYILVSATEMSKLVGYAETLVTTLDVLVVTP